MTGRGGKLHREAKMNIYCRPAFAARLKAVPFQNAVTLNFGAAISAGGDAMTGNASVAKTGAETPKAKIWTSANILLMTMILGVWLGGTFAAAGTVRWIRGWICIAATLLMYAVGTLAVRLKNPALLAARANWGKWEIKPFDRVFITLMFPLYIAQPVVAGLDAVRFRWSSMPLATVYVGLVLLAAGMLLVSWAMAVNPFAEAIVRIQAERHHTTITAGPYHIVRHPIYAGAILMFPAAGLILGSMWTVVVGLALDVLLVWRTAMEDRFLVRELPGYAEYEAVTRYRLVPGIW
jgi:protein-S-isoprenylcysteine O-methyltransferase Ste14